MVHKGHAKRDTGGTKGPGPIRASVTLRVTLSFTVLPTSVTA